jgi:ribosomal protein S6--L-glutamate ligase
MLHDKLLIGRNEWCQMLRLKIPVIKAKIDTGAKTSAIHAFNIQTQVKNGKKLVNFDIHPIQGNNVVSVNCTCPVIDERNVMSSNGYEEHRYIIKTELKIGDTSWDIELSLSNRDPLRYRLLLGRQALNGHVIIDPNLTCARGRLKKKDVLFLYNVKSK